MSWGGLNRALTAWRTAVMKRFPDKDTASDGARADAAHGSTSQHQADADSTVDAYDMDVNVLAGSPPASGTRDERRLVETMKLDFEQDPHARGQLWIHQREIANRDRDNWREREYDGPNPHDKHVHWESRQSHEDDGREWPMPHTDALLRELNGDDVDPADRKAIAKEVVEAQRLALVDDDNGNGLGFQARRVPWAYPMPTTANPDRMMVGAITDMEERLSRIEAALGRLEQASPA